MKKFIIDIVSQMENDGIEPVNVDEIKDAIKGMLNMKADELLLIANNAEIPFVLRKISKEILSSKGVDAIIKLMDKIQEKK